MKLFSIFMLVFNLGSFATGFSQQQLVTLNLKNCSINTVFQEIWKQTGLRFIYNEQDIQNLPPLEVKVRKQQVDKVLDDLFRNTPYRYSLESDVIYVTPRPATPQEQEMVWI